jgi:class 3 adenylate cyclase
MALKDELEKEVANIFRSSWTERNGQVVPAPADLKLGNDAVKLKGTVLYADLSESTAMVENYDDWFSAEIYKSFLHCAAKVIRHFGGSITAYDGDRIMAVFLGNSKNTKAVKAALKINSVRQNIIQPALDSQYPSNTFNLRHTCGIDCSNLFVARTGVRGDNDLVWVGRSANWAAKLSDLPNSHATWISAAVYDVMHESVKLNDDNQNMWEKRSSKTQGDAIIYRSSYSWAL